MKRARRDTRGAAGSADPGDAAHKRHADDRKNVVPPPPRSVFCLIAGERSRLVVGLGICAVGAPRHATSIGRSVGAQHNPEAST